MCTSTMQVHRVTTAVLLALLAALGAVSSTTTASAADAGPLRMQLSHADAGLGLTPSELLRRMALRSKTRAARRFSGSSSLSSATISAVPGAGEYLVSFAIGTPPQPVKMEIDTGSDFTWTQCQPWCQDCYDQQDLPYLDTSNSSTFVFPPCNSSMCQQLLFSSCGTAQGSWGDQTCVYTVDYFDSSATNGLLAADTFTFDGGAAVDGLAFGCGFFNQGFDFNSTGTGIVGFGRGALSLPSQLKLDNFSYCFTNMTGSTPSPVLLGLPANLYGGGGVVQTTPFIWPGSTFYYLNLTSITVGSTTLQVPASMFAVNETDGSGGTFIDSGTTYTHLPPHVFSLLSDAFVSELNMTPVAFPDQPDFFPLCFPASSTQTTMPKLQLQFQGATLDLPQANYVSPLDNYTCVTIHSSDANFTIIGNYQLQNMHILYDIAGNKLSFVPAQCDMV